MRRLLAIVLCLGLMACFAGCDAPQAPETTLPSTQAATEGTTETTTEDTQAPTETTAPVTTAPAGPLAADLAGTWKQTHNEVEGDKTENTNGTITITGDPQSGMTVSFQDRAFPDTNYSDKALTVTEGELFPDCGNSVWYATAQDTGKYSYAMTILEDGSLLVQTGFDFDGQPMVSYQWYARG